MCRNYIRCFNLPLFVLKRGKLLRIVSYIRLFRNQINDVPSNTLGSDPCKFLLQAVTLMLNHVAYLRIQGS
jgi:hypothetical protein